MRPAEDEQATGEGQASSPGRRWYALLVVHEAAAAFHRLALGKSLDSLVEARSSLEASVWPWSLEPGERRQEHFVDDVQDPIVGLHIGSNHMCAIDLDTFSHGSGHRV